MNIIKGKKEKIEWKKVFSVIPKGIFWLISIYRTSIVQNVTLNVTKYKWITYFLWSYIGTQSKMFSDLLVSDFPNYIHRFVSIYNIISIVYNIRSIIKVWIHKTFIIETITNIYTCSSWFEREAWDLFGVFYLNNLDLRRILNDYGFNGHPLKKDFPLSGFSEILFDFILGVIHYEKINLTQEFRFFSINSAWKNNIITKINV